MTDCKQRKIQISAMLDGELNDDERLELMQHIASCDECSRTLAAFSAVYDAVCEDTALPQGLHERITDAVRNSAPRTEKRRSVFLGIAALVACFTLVIFAAQRFAPPANETASGSEMLSVSKGSSAVIADVGVPQDTTGKDQLLNGESTLDISAEELAELLAPSKGASYEAGKSELPEDAETLEFSALSEGGDLVACTVKLVGDRVYADFGDGMYLCSCSASELMSALFD